MKVMCSTITTTIKSKIFKDWEEACLRTGTSFAFWAEGQISLYVCQNWYKKQLARVTHKTYMVTLYRRDFLSPLGNILVEKSSLVMDEQNS